MPTWNKATYEMVAEELGAVRPERGLVADDVHHHLLDRLARGFAMRFAEDNPKFDRERFLRACEGGGPHGRDLGDQ